MVDATICGWLMDNADEPIRYRVARELLKDEQATKKIEPELLENPVVQVWLKKLKPEDPPQYRGMEHGCFDFCLENALPKIVQLGLHGGMPQVKDNVSFYIEKMKKESFDKPYRSKWLLMFISDFLSLANITDELTLQVMIGSLDELYSFTQMKIYDIYISKEERSKLKKVPPKWKERDFINPVLLREYGICYPMIYDIISLYRLYDLKNSDTDEKINSVIDYISTDEFHSKIADGYGICPEEDGRYHSMGWDPKYPGWFDVADYVENVNAPKLLFFAQNISKYPSAVKTKWISDLLDHLEKYKTEKRTYLFPAKWLKESQGYAVQGHHVSFGENRRKKNWLEIESTFYMQLLLQNI